MNADPRFAKGLRSSEIPEPFRGAQRRELTADEARFNRVYFGDPNPDDMRRAAEIRARLDRQQDGKRAADRARMAKEKERGAR